MARFRFRVRARVRTNSYHRSTQSSPPKHQQDTSRHTAFPRVISRPRVKEEGREASFFAPDFDFRKQASYSDSTKITRAETRQDRIRAARGPNQQKLMTMEGQRPHPGGPRPSDPWTLIHTHTLSLSLSATTYLSICLNDDDDEYDACPRGLHFNAPLYHCYRCSKLLFFFFFFCFCFVFFWTAGSVTPM